MSRAENELAMPLTGIRILDLTRLLPGAFCTQLLADMGADVIKVEEPGTGDYMRWTPPLVDGRSALFEALNRNKRSIALDLKSDQGRDALLRLAATADALVEGNRPGVMDRLGLGWKVLHERSPRLVMCSITGYGQDGPFASRAGHDLNYMAVAGDQRLAGRYACYRVYECKDGRHYSVAALEPKFWRALCEGLERPDLVELQYSEDASAQAALEEVFRSRTRDGWTEVLGPLDACCEPVLDLDEVPSHPQVIARRLLDRGRQGRA